MPLSDVRILIVEDDQLVLKGLSAILEMDGAAVYPVSNGRDAIEAVSSFRPDVVLLDVHLKGMSGFDTLEQISAIRPVLPVLLSTGQVGDGGDLADLGLDERFRILRKPYGARELRRALLETLKR